MQDCWCFGHQRRETWCRSRVMLKGKTGCLRRAGSQELATRDKAQGPHQGKGSRATQQMLSLQLCCPACPLYKACPVHFAHPSLQSDENLRICTALRREEQAFKQPSASLSSSCVELDPRSSKPVMLSGAETPSKSTEKCQRKSNTK